MGRRWIAPAGVHRKCRASIGREEARPPRAAWRRDQQRGQKRGDGIGYSEYKHQKGEKVIGHPVADGQLEAVGWVSHVVWLRQSSKHHALSPLLVRKNFLFDRAKRCGRPLIFLGAILLLSDILCDSSHAERLQNQSVYAEGVCRACLSCSLLSLCYRRSSLLSSVTVVPSRQWVRREL